MFDKLIIHSIVSLTGNLPMHTLIKTTEQLGQHIKSARKALKLTQPELALVAGVGVRFIVDLESGKPTVQLQKALDVLAALGTDLSIQAAANGTA